MAPNAGNASLSGSPDLAAAPGALQAEDPECFIETGMDLDDRASPLDSTTVELGGEPAKVCYGAPSARDRTMIGGEEVPYGEPWRMGANEATGLHLTFPAQLGDVELAPGSYSLYAIPDADEWTLVVNGEAERWGIPIDEDVMAQDVGRTPAPRDHPDDEHVETLEIHFEEVDEGEAHLVMEWETYRIAVPLQRIDGEARDAAGLEANPATGG